MTVGYGDIVPVTDAGKALAMALMALGNVVSVGYTALFVGVVIMPELRSVEHRMEAQVLDEEIRIERLAEKLVAAADALQRRIERGERT
jgi:voltage-gated potassium channel Kch